MWKKYFVYVIYNPEREKIYIGQTSDINNRIKRHNNKKPNKIGSYTKVNNGKWALMYSEGFESRSESLKREKELKSAKGREFVWRKIEEYKTKNRL